MKTVDQVYNESLEQIEQIEALTQVCGEILKMTEAMRKREIKEWSGDELSRALSKMSVLRVNLGQELADAMAFYDISYLTRKMRYASEWKPTKDELSKKLKRATIQDIDSTVLEKIAEDYEQEIKSKHRAEKLRILYDSTETLITAMQSRLNTLKAERIEARNQT